MANSTNRSLTLEEHRAKVQTQTYTQTDIDRLETRIQNQSQFIRIFSESGEPEKAQFHRNIVERLQITKAAALAYLEDQIA